MRYDTEAHSVPSDLYGSVYINIIFLVTLFENPNSILGFHITLPAGRSLLETVALLLVSI